MEKDNELKNIGNSLDFGARIYDSRLGRWLSVDPMIVKYPSVSPYSFVENNPIIRIDKDGREWINAHDAAVIYWTGELAKNPNSKNVKRQLEYFTRAQEKVNTMIKDISENHGALYYYIDKLQVTDYRGKQQNVKVYVSYEDGRGTKGEDGRIDGLTTSIGEKVASYVTQVDYNGTPIKIPTKDPLTGKEVYGFNVTIYGSSFSNDNTLANEAGDVMYIMEYNSDKMKVGSDDPKKGSYYKEGESGEYSRRVETSYKDRKKLTQEGNPPSDNPYPLPKEEKK